MNIEVGKTYCQAGTTTRITITDKDGDMFKGDDGRIYTRHGLYNLSKIKSNSEKAARYFSQFNLICECSHDASIKPGKPTNVSDEARPISDEPPKKTKRATPKPAKDLELRIFMALCTVPELAVKLQDGYHSALQAMSIDIAKWSQQ